MSCREFSQNLSAYVDDALDAPGRAACDDHLNRCPVCRALLADIKLTRRGLQNLKRPALSEDLTSALRRAVATEVIAQKATHQPILSRRRWQRFFELRLVPLTVGTFASVLMFAIVFAALQASINAFRRLEAGIAQNDERGSAARIVRLNSSQNTDLPFSAADYAALRSPYALESPSLNPKSSFVSVTSSLMRGEMNDEAVIVVADVFSNGIARVADVLEAPRGKNALSELERVLQSEPAFVPASYDKRPENMRVVLLIQKVDVNENSEAKNNPKNVKRF